MTWRDMLSPHFRFNQEWESDKYGIPYLLNQDHTVEKLLPALYRGYDGYAHFFLDDYRFERVWNTPAKYIDVLKKYHGCLTPDYSLYTDFPLAMQIWNTYRNRYLGRYCQELGIKVIPTISWSTKESYDFCFCGVPTGSVVAISTIGVRVKDKELFFAGYQMMREILKPKQVLIYGRKKDFDIEGMWFEDESKQRGWS
jgi:hypothetical protein